MTSISAINQERPMKTEKVEKATSGAPLLDFWYPALLSKGLKRSRMKRQMVANIPLLLARDKAGQAFALDDHCPHRGIPLTDGWFDGELVECCYHGWKFDCDGRCREIPALLPDSAIKPEKIRARSFQTVEEDGYVWVFLPGELAKKGQAMAFPKLPVFSPKYEQAIISRKLACNVDHGIIGLMDPAHGPFVHQSFWWRSRGSIHAKAKTFEPIPYGFRMSAHAPSKNSGPYKLLKVFNEPITTTIDFVLPNVRYEQVRCGRYWFSSRTVVTPITTDESRLDIVSAWNILRGAPLVKSLAKFFGHLFVAQDQRIMEKQSVGLRDNPPLMLIDDADTQAKWYYKLKAAFLEMQRGGEFVHPLKDKVTLRWRS